MSTQFTPKIFEKDIKTHRVQILLDTPDHKHLHCRRADGSGDRNFDIVTWKDHLAYSGDMGEFMFHRYGHGDLFSFFRANQKASGYVAEKCVAGKKFEFSDDAIPEFVQDRLAQTKEDQEQPDPDLEAQVEDFIGSLEGNIYYDIAKLQDFANEHKELGMDDTCEWASFERATFHFEWCVSAIAWAIQQYDQVKGNGKIDGAAISPSLTADADTYAIYKEGRGWYRPKSQGYAYISEAGSFAAEDKDLLAVQNAEKHHVVKWWSSEMASLCGKCDFDRRLYPMMVAMKGGVA